MYLENGGIMKKEFETDETELAELYRALHERAEVGFDLSNTVAYIENKLAEYGLNAVKLGRGSLTALVDIGREKTLLLRADIDAIPIKEETGLSHSARGETMHACGHDMHAAILLYTAKILKKNEKDLSCNVKFLFQGAEELLLGADDCIKNGLLTDKPRPNYAIGMHVLCGLPIKTGTLIIPRSGEVAPAADFFTINIIGKSSHAATSSSQDALFVLGELITTLPHLPRFVSPTGSPSLISIGKAEGGTAANVTAESASLSGSARSFSDKIQKKLKERIVHHTKSICRAYGVGYEINFGGSACVLKNDAELIKGIQRALSDDKNLEVIDLSKDKSDNLSSSSGGSEDFANIADKIPSVFLAIAAGDRREGYIEPLHSSRVVFDEKAMKCGVYSLVKIALSIE